MSTQAIQPLFPGLPQEMSIEIFSRASPIAVLQCRIVCKDWQKALENPAIWRALAAHLQLIPPQGKSFEQTVRTYVVTRLVEPRLSYLKDTLFKIALAQQGEVVTKRGIFKKSPKPLQSLTPFPPPPVLPIQDNYFGDPDDHKECFDLVKFDHFARKVVWRELVTGKQLNHEDKAGFIECLKQPQRESLVAKIIRLIRS